MFLLIRPVLHADARVGHVQGGDTCLHIACRNGHLEVVKCLLQEGGKELTSIRNKHSQTALDCAKSKDEMDVAAFLNID